MCGCLVGTGLWLHYSARMSWGKSATVSLSWGTNVFVCIWVSIIHNTVELGEISGLMVLSVKMAVIWNAVPCSLVEIYWCLRVLTASINIALMMETASTSAVWVSVYQTTQCNLSEDIHLDTVELWKSVLACFILVWLMKILKLMKFVDRVLSLKKLLFRELKLRNCSQISVHWKCSSVCMMIMQKTRCGHVCYITG
jgi:hypothetical protein